MKIDEVRAQIDEMDDQIVDLFLKRLQLCKIIGDLKRTNNLPIFNELREQEILNKVTKKDPDNAEHIRQLYSEIFKICRKIQTQ